MSNVSASESGAETAPEPAAPRGWLRRLYAWFLEASRRPAATRILFMLAFAESMFFPIPPDAMLIPMGIAEPKRAFRFALICSVASLLGGIGGYMLGHYFWEVVQEWFFAYVPGFTQHRFEDVQTLYETWDFWVVFTAGFTPIPYKVITITAGVFEIAFGTFILASAISRSARFFLVAWMCRRFGPPAQVFIERYLGWLALAFVALLIGGFVLISKL